MNSADQDETSSSQRQLVPKPSTPYPRWLIWTVYAYGLVLLVWLTPEDNSVATVTVLGTALALLVALHSAVRWATRWRLWSRGVALRRVFWVGLGAGCGAGATIGTVLLMFLKTAVHAHPYPDFPPLLMIAMLERMPTWALAGALVGLAAALIDG